MELNIDITQLGPDASLDDFITLQETDDGRFIHGQNGTKAIVGTRDGKIEFVFFENHILGYVKSALGYPAYYPLHSVEIKKPVKAVLMDLDGTSVHSEHFWIWIIQLTVASLLANPEFQLENDDIPYVSGHSVSEHLQYCITKYCPDKTVEEARRFYFKHTHHEMNEITEGCGKADAFTPAPGLKDFLLELKKQNIKIGLVTSGLYEKDWESPLNSEIRSLELKTAEPGWLLSA